ncbi:hypothetical protein [Mycoplasma sp. Ms02]|uniref:hypothetical protein n=1 Tax=Mycoplasma sp. Ms02 TaxID=353851 RepID=UPI001C8A8092|nr:hypothetical protein [Mycoplasma sp. Ms02]QZE12578.1 hypothetical protein K4L35_01160 [Mycoplasma sp. Ms02]
MNDLLAKEPKATQQELQEMQQQIESAVTLAQTLKEAQEQLDTIDKDQHPEAYENLKNVIANNAIGLDDDKNAYALKVKNIKTEQGKTELRKDINDELEKLAAVYSEQDSKKAIHEQDADDVKALVAKYQAELNNPDTTQARLAIIKSEIKRATQEAEAQKARTQKEYDDTVANLENLRTFYNDQAALDGVTNKTKIDEIFAEFDDIKAKQNSDGSYPTTTQQLKELQKKLDLAYQKDLAAKKLADLKDKISNLPEVTNSDGTTQEVKDKMNALADLIGNEASSIDDINKVSDVKAAIAKLDALEALAERQKSVIEQLNQPESANSETAEAERQKIIVALKENVPATQTNGSLRKASDVSVSEIRQDNKDLLQAFVDNAELQKAKNLQQSAIDQFKNNLETTLTANNNVLDPKLAEVLKGATDALTTELTGVTDKAQIIPVDGKLEDLRDKRDSLIALGRDVKTANDKAAELENSQDPAEIKIRDEIKKLTEKTQNEYLTLTPEQIQQRQEEIQTLLDNLNKSKEAANKFKEIKAELAAITYPDGDGTLPAEKPQSGAEAKDLFDKFIDSLITQVYENADKTDVLEDLLSQIPPLKSLLDKHKVQIGTSADGTKSYTTIKEDTDYTGVVHNDQNEQATYGFEKDAQKYANAILRSIPSLRDPEMQNFTNIERIIPGRLEEETRDVWNLYKSRKRTLDELIFNRASNSEPDYDANRNKALKYSEYNQLKGDAALMPTKYNLIWANNNKFYHEQAQKIANSANNLSADDQEILFQNVSAESGLFDSVFEQYIEVADKVQLAKDGINKAETYIQEVNNPSVTEDLSNTVRDLKAIIAQIEENGSIYFKNKSSIELQRFSDDLANLTALLDLGIAVSKALKSLEDYNTVAEQNGQLVDYMLVDGSNSDKTPLRNIIRKPFELLETGLPKNQETYDDLRNKYIEGNTNESYLVAKENTVSLRKAVHIAKSYLAVKNETNEQFSRKNDILALFTDIQSKVSESEIALYDVNHDESKKIKFEGDLMNSTSGLISRLKKAKSDEVKNQLAAAKRLNRLMTSLYSNATTSPINSNFVDVAITQLERTTRDTPEAYTDTNEKLKASVQALKDQFDKVWSWESNKFKSYKDRYQPYFEIFKNGITGESETIDGSAALQTAGISQSDVELFESILTFESMETKVNAAKANQDDLSAYLDQMRVVALEISGHSRNLDTLYSRINILSVPKLKAESTQFDRLAEQFKTTDENSTSNIYTVLKKLGFPQESSELKNRFDGFNTSYTAISDVKTLSARVEDRNVSQEQAVSEQVKQERTAQFEKYKQAVAKLTVANRKADMLIYGSDTSDANSLKNTVNKAILGDSSYVGLTQIKEFLSNLSENNIETRYEKAIFEYQKSADIAKVMNAALQALNKQDDSKAKSTRTEEFTSIKKVAENMESFSRWFDTESHISLVLSSLGEKVNTEEGAPLVYQNNKPLDATSGEVFKKIVDTEDGRNEANLTVTDKEINGRSYKAINLSPEQGKDKAKLLEKFEQMNILKGTAAEFFKSDNFKVYLLKESDASSFVDLVLQSDTTIKKGFVNLYFEYVRPTSITQANSAFYNVEKLNALYKNVAITFKTFSEIRVNKEMLSTTNIGNTLFTSEEAGWEPIQTAAYLASAFANAGHKTLIDKKLSYYTERVDEDIDAQISLPEDRSTTLPFTTADGQNQELGSYNQTTSPDSFRIKIKMKPDFNGYTQHGDFVYWKPLNPVFMSDDEIKYTETRGVYWDNDFPVNLGRDTWNQNNLIEYWEQRYRFNESKDAGKVLSVLPIIISIPMTRNAGPGLVDNNSVSVNGNAALVIRLLIINRFDKNSGTTPQVVKLSDDDFGKNFYIFNAKADGDSKIVSTPEAFAQNTLNNIKFHQWTRTAYKGLNWRGINILKPDSNGVFNRPESKDWGEDSNFVDKIEKFEMKFKIQ